MDTSASRASPGGVSSQRAQPVAIVRHRPQSLMPSMSPSGSPAASSAAGMAPLQRAQRGPGPVLANHALRFPLDLNPAASSSPVSVGARLQTTRGSNSQPSSPKRPSLQQPGGSSPNSAKKQRCASQGTGDAPGPMLGLAGIGSLAGPVPLPDMSLGRAFSAAPALMNASMPINIAGRSTSTAMVTDYMFSNNANTDSAPWHAVAVPLSDRDRAAAGGFNLRPMPFSLPGQSSSWNPSSSFMPPLPVQEPVRFAALPDPSGFGGRATLTKKDRSNGYTPPARPPATPRGKHSISPGYYTPREIFRSPHVSNAAATAPEPSSPFCARPPALLVSLASSTPSAVSPAHSVSVNDSTTSQSGDGAANENNISCVPLQGPHAMDTDSSDQKLLDRDHSGGSANRAGIWQGARHPDDMRIPSHSSSASPSAVDGGVVTPHGTASIPISSSPSHELLQNCYTFGRPLGIGDFGQVFEARENQSQRLVAIKVCTRPLSSLTDLEFKLRSLSAVSSHPNLVRIERCFVESGRIFFVMEHCDGGTLDARHKQKDLSFVDEPFIWDEMHQLASALAALHSKRLIHMDIKPENILVQHSPTSKVGILKLGDFDLMRFQNENSPVFCEGDARYMSAEVLQERATCKADVFSLGMMMFELIADVELPKDDGPALNRIKSGELEFPQALFQPSWHLQSLIKRMLAPEAQRLTSQDVVDCCELYRSGRLDDLKAKLEPSQRRQRSRSLGRVGRPASPGTDGAIRGLFENISGTSGRSHSTAAPISYVPVGNDVMSRLDPLVMGPPPSFIQRFSGAMTPAASVLRSPDGPSSPYSFGSDIPLAGLGTLPMEAEATRQALQGMRVSSEDVLHVNGRMDSVPGEESVSFRDSEFDTDED